MYSTSLKLLNVFVADRDAYLIFRSLEKEHNISQYQDIIQWIFEHAIKYLISESGIPDPEHGTWRKKD